MNLRKLHKAISILCAALLIVSLGAIAFKRRYKRLQSGRYAYRIDSKADI